jgi:hypothetical protein
MASGEVAKGRASSAQNWRIENIAGAPAVYVGATNKHSRLEMSRRQMCIGQKETRIEGVVGKVGSGRVGLGWVGSRQGCAPQLAGKPNSPFYLSVCLSVCLSA